jgi:hypothetical protein
LSFAACGRTSRAVVLLFAVCAAQAAAAPRPSVRDSAAFTVVDVPGQALDLDERALRFAPRASGTASTGTYAHAGAEYGIVLAGTITRWEAGETRDVHAGRAFASSLGGVSASTATQPAVQMSAVLAPAGETASRPAPGVAAAAAVMSIYDNVFALGAGPATPFTLVEQLIDLPPGSSTIRFSYGARAFFTVANGTVVLERGGALSYYQLGKPFRVGAGESIRLANVTRRLASVMVVLLLPETVRLTAPTGAY